MSVSIEARGKVGCGEGRLSTKPVTLTHRPCRAGHQKAAALTVVAVERLTRERDLSQPHTSLLHAPPARMPRASDSPLLFPFTRSLARALYQWGDPEGKGEPLTASLAPSLGAAGGGWKGVWLGGQPAGPG